MRHISETTVKDCALLAVKRRTPDGLKDETAIATLGVWAVTPCDYIKGRFVITHVLTGYKTGPDMTERDALRTLARLRDLHIASNADLIAKRVQLWEAHPAQIRKSWRPEWVDAPDSELNPNIDPNIITEVYS